MTPILALTPILADDPHSRPGEAKVHNRPYAIGTNSSRCASVDTARARTNTCHTQIRSSDQESACMQDSESIDSIRPGNSTEPRMNSNLDLTSRLAVVALEQAHSPKKLVGLNPAAQIRHERSS